MTTASLWHSTDLARWRQSLEAYDDVIAAQGVRALVAHDRWYREELPELLRGRDPMYATLDDLVRLTEWKMARGVYRVRNLALVNGNDAGEVKSLTMKALALAPHPLAPVRELTALAGVGPATASALASAAFPETYPFFDELVAAQIPDLPDVAFTLVFYGRYADALRTRAEQLGHSWTPVRTERALWSHSGGKIASKEKLR